MSLFIAVLALSSLSSGKGAAAAAPDTPPAAAQVSAGETRPALDWLAMLDAQHWNDSWKNAGALFRSKVPAADWASMVQGVRNPLGAVLSRSARSVTRTTTLPGLPPGHYMIIQFASDFANKQGAVETVALTLEAGGWKVDGYFIR